MSEQANMAARYEREIPEGYEARIEGNKVIFELKESEDERIRTCIRDVIKENDWTHIFGVKKEDCLAYLERQKEQKPAEWSEEDKRMIDDIIYCLPRMAMGNIEMLPSVAEQYAQRLETLRDNYKKCNSRWKPSEEQMKALQCAIVFMEIRKAPDYDISPLKELCEQLEKL